MTYALHARRWYRPSLDQLREEGLAWADAQLQAHYMEWCKAYGPPLRQPSPVWVTVLDKLMEVVQVEKPECN